MNCGKTLPDGAKFCKFCGTPQDAVAPTAPSNSETINLDGTHTFVPAMCPNCNAHMKVDSSSKIARCDACGTECLVQDAIKNLSVRGNVQVGNATINVSGANTESLLKRAEIMLADGDFLGAKEKCNTILDSDPTNAKAYILMLMSVLHVRRQDDLANCKQLFDTNNFYIKAMQFGDEETKAKLTGYLRQINERQRIDFLTKFYNQGLWMMKTASKEADYLQAIEIFKKISDFKDSNEQIQQCIRAIEEIKAGRIKARIEYERIQKERKKLITKILVISGSVIAVFLLFLVLYLGVIIPNQKYKKAKEYLNSGDYDSAYALLKELGKTDEIEANKYDRAIALLNSGDYDAAYVLLKEIGKTDEIEANKYNRAIALLNSGDYDGAYVLLYQIDKTDEVNESKYNRAVSLINSGDYETAYLLLEDLQIYDYKDSSSKLKEIEPLYFKLLLSKAKIGDSICFGLYEQDNDISNGKEYIEWIVLDKKGYNVLVTSKYAIDCISYNNQDEDITWSQCYLRSWLNEDFYNEAFDTVEQEQIVTTKVYADKNPDFDTSPGEDTNDKVFILSMTEVEKYFNSKESRRCVTTNYVQTKNENFSRFTVWYLRTPGRDSRSVSVVMYEGAFSSYYEAFDNDAPCAVRPAMWISTAD